MKKTAALFTIIAMAGLLSACGAARWVRTPLLEGSRTTVNLEHRVEKDQITPQHYNHPYKMPLQDVGKLLGDLAYNEKAVLLGRQNETPVFQAIEIATLAPALTDALTKASPDQRIQFTSFNKGGGLLFKNTRKTEGVLFVEPKDRINLAFNLINEDVVTAESQDSPQMYTNSDPLKVRFSDTVLIPNASYTDIKQFDNGKPAPMWVVADAGKLKEAVASAPKPAPAPVVIAPEKPIIAPFIQTSPPVTPAPKPVMEPKPATAAPPAPAGAVPQETNQQDIKNKLQYLKELYESGLITEPEYQAEKKKLLDKIN
ncbi:MAG: SHOCT domain-containing protein [Desulfobacteraceae bacterium]|nr:MAG: SHOCT domain-containing protein [Desulfobacteraceae bacterium]